MKKKDFYEIVGKRLSAEIPVLRSEKNDEAADMVQKIVARLRVLWKEEKE